MLLLTCSVSPRSWISLTDDKKSSPSLIFAISSVFTFSCIGYAFTFRLRGIFLGTQFQVPQGHKIMAEIHHGLQTCAASRQQNHVVCEDQCIIKILCIWHPTTYLCKLRKYSRCYSPLPDSICKSKLSDNLPHHLTWHLWFVEMNSIKYKNRDSNLRSINVKNSSRHSTMSNAFDISMAAANTLVPFWLE